jgi:hypothetical protein
MGASELLSAAEAQLYRDGGMVGGGFPGHSFSGWITQAKAGLTEGNPSTRTAGVRTRNAQTRDVQTRDVQGVPVGCAAMDGTADRADARCRLCFTKSG